MKRQLMILATLVALAIPAMARAGDTHSVSPEATAAPSAAVPGSVDAAELTNLLEEKGVITPQEQRELTHSSGTPAVDAETMRQIFQTAPYENE